MYINFMSHASNIVRTICANKEHHILFCATYISIFSPVLARYNKFTRPCVIETDDEAICVSTIQKRSSVSTYQHPAHTSTHIILQIHRH